MNAFDLSLYLVTDRALSLDRPLEEVVEAAVKGGVTMVQLREKECASRTFLELALLMKRCLKPYGVPLIINDRLDIALASDAEGLHLGQQDLPYQIARRLLGKEKIIGLSVETLEDVHNANELDLDYIGLSPVFSTPTKRDTAPPLGLEGVEAFTAISRHPAVAIGGIHEHNTAQIMQHGADGIAVVSAIMSADDPQLAAAHLSQLVQQSRKSR